MTPLEAVLAGRDERAETQCRLLASSPDRVLVQAALNIPGYPKRVEGDEAAVAFVCATLQERAGQNAVERVSLVNGAGVCAILVFTGGEEAARRLKEAALELEEEAACGRVLDIDVITTKGAVTRSSLGRSPRQCLICGREAKFCAASRAHDLAELRKAALDLTHDYAETHHLLL